MKQNNNVDNNSNNKQNKTFSKKNNVQINDDKLKPLMPTLRVKKRFLRFQVQGDKKFEFKELSEELIEQLIYLIGAIDFSKGGIWILRDKFDYKNQELIVKCSTKQKDKLIGALSLITKLKGNSAKLVLKKVSGTLKGVKEE